RFLFLFRPLIKSYFLFSLVNLKPLKDPLGVVRLCVYQVLLGLVWPKGIDFKDTNILLV
ncbi:MAG: hypothetical protein ACI9QN_000520, partial [Arcticibacterium sp.]